jgi:hydroxyacylglutathione hydrolase
MFRWFKVRLCDGKRTPSAAYMAHETNNLLGCSLGSLCHYEPRAKVLFSGDTVFPDGNIGRTDMYGGSTPDLMASIERLTGLDVETMYPGHMEITSSDVKRQIQMSLRFPRSVL